jgi:hypothetical protein
MFQHVTDIKGSSANPIGLGRLTRREQLVAILAGLTRPLRFKLSTCAHDSE